MKVVYSTMKAHVAAHTRKILSNKEEPSEGCNCRENGDPCPDLPTLKSLINEQGGYVVFFYLCEYSFIRDFRVRERS